MPLALRHILLSALCGFVLVAPAQLGFYAVAVSLAELPQTAFMQMKNILFAESAARDSMLLIARACRLPV